MFEVDQHGFFGEFGGSYIPEMLFPNVSELQQRYRQIIDSAAFCKEFEELLRSYVGRPTPLYLATRLSARLGYSVWLKREDLAHTGAHKINNAIGQVLLARALGRTRIIAETGAGQHGVATATACALFGLKCVVYMGAIDIERQAPNVMRMQMLGATVVPVTSGSKVLKDAANEALRDWVSNPTTTHYIIGSAVGPHPFPDMVARFQSVISAEVIEQFPRQSGVKMPDCVVACVGGGSNAIGIFYHYLPHSEVKLIGVEAAGAGLDSGRTAASIARGSLGILHGSKSLVLQSKDGQIEEAHSISAGLDYPGIGPQHAYLHSIGRVEYVSATDDEAIEGVRQIASLEGIIPALESAHAIAYLERLKLPATAHVVLCLSGRGDKDLATYARYGIGGEA